MDETDERIISALDSGTLKYAMIARKLGLPISTVHFRVKRLEANKVVRRYRAEIDWKRAGMGITAFIFVNVDIELLKRTRHTQEMLLKELLGIPYVREGHVITGDADILVKVMAHDSSHLKAILLKSIDAKEGVVGTKTIIVLD